MKYSSVGAIIYHQGRYLLQRRSRKKNIYFSGMWGVFGGGVYKNETPKQALKRELKEELNLSFGNFKPIIFMNIKSRDFKQKRYRHYLECKLKKNFKKFIHLNEGLEFKFFTLKDITCSNIVPWDYSAILYHNLSFVKKKRVIPQRI